MFLYIDHIFAEGGEREVKPLHSIPDTLSELYLLAMREHRRPAALRFREGGSWEDVPDWRFDRHTIRLGLFLEERGLLSRGDRIALIAPLRPQWPSIDLAAICSGGVSVTIPGDASREALAAALATERPRVICVAGDVYTAARPVLNLFEETEAVIVVNGSRQAGDATISYDTALDLGGTHDTPENAQRFRARARNARPEDLAIRHYSPGANGQLQPLDFTHAQVLEELKSLWARVPAREGDRVYLAPGEVSLSARWALYAHLGDGYSTIYLGSPQREAEEIAEIRPQVIVAPAATLKAIIEERRGGGESARDSAGDRPRGLLARLKRGRRAEEEQNAIREAFGGRVRYVSSTTPPDPALSALLSEADAPAVVRRG